ncbi:MAG: type 1 glutamine amidotransferase domain-containing protein [Myxococcota bacterium]
MPTYHKRVAILAEDVYEDLELWVPYYRLKEAGCEVTLLGAGKDTYQGKHGLPVKVDGKVDDADAESFHAVVIPGGYAPDKMRRHQPMIDFVRAADEANRIVAFICHAGWVAASAGIVRGRTVTSFFSIRDDLDNAGAEWVDREVVRDGNLISSRMPPDLPVFCRTLVGALQEMD